MENDFVSGILFLLLSLISIFGAFYLVTEDKKARRASTVKTQAVVTNFYSSGWRAEYKFNANGYEVTVQSQIKQKPPMFKDGQVTDLYYNPHNPTQIYVPKERFVICFFIFCAVFLSAVALWGGISYLI